MAVAGKELRKNIEKPWETPNTLDSWVEITHFDGKCDFGGSQFWETPTSWWFWTSWPNVFTALPGNALLQTYGGLYSHRVQCKFHQLPKVLFLLDEGTKCDWRPYVYGILGTNAWFSVDFLLVKPTQWLQTVAACHGRSISNPHSKQHMFCVLQCLGLHWYCCGSKKVWLVCHWSCAILQYNAQNMTMMHISTTSHGPQFTVFNSSKTTSILGYVSWNNPSYHC